MLRRTKENLYFLPKELLNRRIEIKDSEMMNSYTAKSFNHKE